MARNGAFESKISDVALLTFDAMGDIDDLTNLAKTEINATAITLNWTPIRSVDGYIVTKKMPVFYPEIEPIKTKNHNLTRMLFDKLVEQTKIH